MLFPIIQCKTIKKIKQKRMKKKKYFEANCPTLIKFYYFFSLFECVITFPSLELWGRGEIGFASDGKEEECGQTSTVKQSSLFRENQ